MQCFINGQTYSYIDNVKDTAESRRCYFQLAKKIYGLNFEKWYQSGYWDGCYIPYIIMHGDIAVSSVAVCINDINWQSRKKRYVQISTVMTLPEYRNKGLNRYLMETILSEWKDKCDAIYLLANDSVVNFYPKFGFEEFKEFQYSKPIHKTNSIYKKLDIENSEDWNLIIEKYKLSNPFTKLKVDNLSQFIFHCIQFMSNDIYYIRQYDAVVIMRYDGGNLICYDIFTDCNCQIDDILGAMASDKSRTAILGFTPKSTDNWSVEENPEEDNHLFVLKGKENVYKDNKVMFPMLSRA